MNEQSLYKNIGQLLIVAGPLSAVKIIARVELFSEGDGGKCEFDYISESGDQNWFDPDGRAIGDLTDLLLKLRECYLLNGLTAEGAPWSGCEIVVDVVSSKLSIDYKYED